MQKLLQLYFDEENAAKYKNLFDSVMQGKVLNTEYRLSAPLYAAIYDACRIRGRYLPNQIISSEENTYVQTKKQSVNVVALRDSMVSYYNTLFMEVTGNKDDNTVLITVSNNHVSQVLCTKIFHVQKLPIDGMYYLTKDKNWPVKESDFTEFLDKVNKDVQAEIIVGMGAKYPYKLSYRNRIFSFIDETLSVHLTVTPSQRVQFAEALQDFFRVL